MNLENLNLVELNAQEVKETEGGFWWLALAEIAYEVVRSQADIKAGYNDTKEYFEKK
jgi:hypothetical protein